MKKQFAMQTKFIKYCNYALLFATLCIVITSVLLTSCQKEKVDTSIVLKSFGPMPIARGAELQFIGTNLDKVTSVVLPENIEITTFTTKTSKLITLTVPQEAVPGLIVLKTPDGDITTKTEIGFSEPISIAGFLPATIKPGSELTITGDYLNLVEEIIFTDRVTVPKASFTSQSRTEIKVNVPATSITGKIAVSNGAEDPIIVYSATNLTVTLPAFTSVTPNPVKAGTQLTIAGTNLDLVKTVVLGGNKSITTFVSQSASAIVLAVPADTKDGKVTLIPASNVNVLSAADLVMVVPTVSVTPTTLKNGADITVTGTDLDLVDKVIFGGDKQGTIKAGGTETQILVTVPDDAVTGVVTFVTKAIKEVAGPSLTIIDPVFTSFSPASASAKTDLTITGTDLDLVVDVVFTDNVTGTIGARTETQLTVTVPVGAKTGKITLVTKNGNQILSPTDLTVLANLPAFGSYSEAKGTPGQILTINGTSLLLIKELIFPGDIYATAYGIKTDTKIEVYVPMDATLGYGTIKLITYEGEEGILPQVFIGGTDPIVDPSLIITTFTDGFSQWGYWGGIAATENDPAIALDGDYMHGTSSSVSGWQWVWANNWISFPSVTTADHLFKMDVRLDKPFGTTNVHFQMELGGNRIDIGAFGITTATTVGWVTVTFDLSTISGLPAQIPAGGEWGINSWYADGPVDMTGLYVDNLRFEHK
jgi:hypothetical protein